MPATLDRRRPTTPAIRDLHALVESYAIRGENGGSLRIDEENGIIYGVKLGGRFSENCHGIRGVTEGTEYKPAAYKGALSLYEGAKVYVKHARKPADSANRGPFESMGVIRNARYDEQSDCPRGDFHYKKTHPNTAELIEDVKRGMGTFGFSHHIPPGGYVGRVQNGRLVIEQIKEIKSVDLVDDPATTRNLWESTTVATTFKAILESHLTKVSKARQAIGKKLLEDASMPADVMDAPVEDAGGEPDDMLWQGFVSACTAILNGDGSAKEKGKKITEYLTAHEKLMGKAEPKEEPETPAATEEDEDDGEPDEKKDAKESKEVKKLRAENACLKAGVEATPELLEALSLLDTDAKRTKLLESVAPKAGAPAKPASKAKSSGPGAKPIQESKESKVPSGKSFAESLRA